MSRRKTTVAVLGAGPGGYAAAFRASELGLDTTLIDPRDLGGVCLHRGCIPSKVLLHVASTLRAARDAEGFGVHFPAPQVDIGAVRAFRDEVVGRLAGGLRATGERLGVKYIEGRGRFLGPTEIEIDARGSRYSIGFEHAVIATGSKPVALDALPFDPPRVFDSAAALELQHIPRRLVIVGGGAIGLEMATVYSALGSRITVVEAERSLLPGVDPELVGPLHRALERDGVRIELGARLCAAHRNGDGLVIDVAGRGELLRADAVMVAVGRRPRTECLGLRRTPVDLAPDGSVRTFPVGRTTAPRIWAVGDVTGAPLLAHAAHHAGRAIAEQIAGGPSNGGHRVIPAVVYTSPEVAFCGYDAEQARTAGIAVEVGRFDWRASGRAHTLGAPDGLTKLVFERGTQRLLGGGITGAGAGELIAQIALAIEMKAHAIDLAATVHPHPTSSETVMHAARAVLHSSL